MSEAVTMQARPEGIYAIGDVHGRADLLAPLLDSIGQDAEERGITPRILFLGDIVDRGPSSREAMDLVCRTLDEQSNSRLILGNHDSYLLEFMSDERPNEERFQRWLTRIGGYATIQSYGLSHCRSAREISEAFRRRYDHHLQVLRGASRIILQAPYAFVHAGIDPSREIDDQDPYDLMWIRKGFIDHDGPLPYVVVHGHTVTDSNLPEVREYRIALDTGAYHSGRLCCLVLPTDPEDLRFLVAEGENRLVSVRELRFDQQPPTLTVENAI